MFIKAVTLLWTGEAVHGLLGMYIILVFFGIWRTSLNDQLIKCGLFIIWYFIIPFACEIGGNDLQRQTDSLTVYFYVLLFAIYIYSKYDWFDWFNLHIHYHTFSRWHGSFLRWLHQVSFNYNPVVSCKKGYPITPIYISRLLIKATTWNLEKETILTLFTVSTHRHAS